jgi:hypothetical protein
VGEFSEDRDESIVRIDIYAEFVRAASEALHERARLCIIRLNDRAAGRPIQHRPLIARLSTASAATEDDELKVWFADLDHIQAFDPVDGRKPRPPI